MKKSLLSAYSSIYFPLSFIGLPIYLNIANFYVDKFAISVTMIGILILVSRFIDVFQDPFIGSLSDYFLKKKNITRKKIIIFFLPFLSISFFLLFNPPKMNANLSVILWFLTSLTATYTFFSIIMVNYTAIAAEIAENYNSRTKIVAFREFIGLFGIFFASILPYVIAHFFEISQNQAFSILSAWFFPIICFVSLLIFLRFFKVADEINLFSTAPSLRERTKIKDFRDTNFHPKMETGINRKIDSNLFKNLSFIFKNHKFNILLAIFFLNSVAISLASSNFVFFIEDVLKQKSKTGLFFATFFFCAILTMPIWNKISGKIGKRKTWILAMILSFLSFFYAFFLKEGQYVEFLIICAFSGAMLGADLIIPSSILADLTNKDKENFEKTSSYFAVWNSTSKLALAFASGIAYIFLGLNGFRDENASIYQQNHSLFYLAIIYAIIPSLIKVATVIILYFSNVDKNYKEKI